MELSLLHVLLLAAASVESAVVRPRQAVAPQINDPLCLSPGGKVPDPPGAAPRKVVMDSGITGTQRVKLRYGPYSVPNMTTQDVMGESGSLWNCGDDKVEKPCEECAVLRMAPGVEYANGSNANIDTGMWLHHLLLYTVGPTRWDPTCIGKESAPHAAVGVPPSYSERSFAVGNERMPIDFGPAGVNGKRAGYLLTKEDHFRLILGLQNMNMDDRTVYFTIEFDFINGPAKKDQWMDLKPVWLDVDLCGFSEIKSPQKPGAFMIESKPWVPNFEGDILGLEGHLHDGGVNLQIFSSPSTEVCNSVAKYGESRDYIYNTENNAMGLTNMAEKHISSMSTCSNQMKSVQRLEKSQGWILRGHYDYGRFPGNTEKDGGHRAVMGIALMYVAVSPGGVPAPK